MITSMSLAVLESTVPIWVMDTMKAKQWQLGNNGLTFPSLIEYSVPLECQNEIPKNSYSPNELHSLNVRKGNQTTSIISKLHL